MITRKNIATAVAAGLLAACSAQSNPIGSYVASDADAALMVQITSIHDGQVNGIISLVGAADDGKNIAGTRHFTGTIEGKALNLSVENGTGVNLATGELDGDTLTLTLFANGHSSQFSFAKSDAENFARLANASRVRAAEKKQDVESEAALKDRVDQRSKTQRTIDQLADRSFAKADGVSEKTRKIDVVIAGYRTATDRTAKMQSAKRNIDSGSSEGSYRISQIDYRIDSLAGDMKSTHESVQSYLTDLNSFISEAALKSAQFSAECQADRLLNCSRLSAGVQLLQSRYQQFKRAQGRENAAFPGRGGNHLAMQ